MAINITYVEEIAKSTFSLFFIVIHYLIVFLYSSQYTVFCRYIFFIRIQPNIAFKTFKFLKKLFIANINRTIFHIYIWLKLELLWNISSKYNES